MRSALAVAPVLLALAVPSAHACTLDNCVEVKSASTTWNGTDLHSLSGRCVVAGRAGVRFTVTAEAEARDGLAGPADETSVRCVVTVGTTVVYDQSAVFATTVAVLSDAFVSGPNIRVCVSASAHWSDGAHVSSGTCP